MPQSVIKQVEYKVIKKYWYEDLIFTDRNGRTLEVYNYVINTHDATTGVDNNYNICNRNNSDYEDGANDEEYGPTYKYESVANATHEYGSRCPPTPATNNTPDNYEQEMMD